VPLVTEQRKGRGEQKKKKKKKKEREGKKNVSKPL
jgi:hypothetical protein